MEGLREDFLDKKVSRRGAGAQRGFHAKGALPSKRALYKLLYLVSSKVQKKWSRPVSWTKVISILTMTYPERLEPNF